MSLQWLASSSRLIGLTLIPVQVLFCEEIKKTSEIILNQKFQAIGKRNQDWHISHLESSIAKTL